MAPRVGSPHPRERPLPEQTTEKALQLAADFLRDADALLICTGAGMGVDSGLGTYRGRNAGSWAPLQALRMGYTAIVDPDWFDSDPRLAWAYWGHCYHAYSAAAPHAGYGLLAKWGGALEHGFFSVTTNIDGHWERTVSPDKLLECHGSVLYLQHLDGQGAVRRAQEADFASVQAPEWDLAPGDVVEMRVATHGEWGAWSPATVGVDGFSIFSPDGQQLAAHGLRRPAGPDLLRVEDVCALPCFDPGGQLARPNVLMFGDSQMNNGRVNAQEAAFLAWKESLPADARLVVVEVGAGRAIPVMRDESEQALRKFPRASLIRINLDDPEVGQAFTGRAVSVGGLGALESLQRIDALVGW